jgi:hypothetical protein
MNLSGNCPEGTASAYLQVLQPVLTFGALALVLFSLMIMRRRRDLE